MFRGSSFHFCCAANREQNLTFGRITWKVGRIRITFGRKALKVGRIHIKKVTQGTKFKSGSADKLIRLCIMLTFKVFT